MLDAGAATVGGGIGDEEGIGGAGAVGKLLLGTAGFLVGLGGTGGGYIKI